MFVAVTNEEISQTNEEAVSQNIMKKVTRFGLAVFTEFVHYTNEKRLLI